LPYRVAVTPVVYRALQSHRHIGLAWLMQRLKPATSPAGPSDLAIHGNGIVPLRCFRRAHDMLVSRGRAGSCRATRIAS